MLFLLLGIRNIPFNPAFAQSCRKRLLALAADLSLCLCTSLIHNKLFSEPKGHSRTSVERSTLIVQQRHSMMWEAVVRRQVEMMNLDYYYYYYIFFSLGGGKEGGGHCGCRTAFSTYSIAKVLAAFCQQQKKIPQNWSQRSCLHNFTSAFSNPEPRPG